jgi:hypothetical protein
MHAGVVSDQVPAERSNTVYVIFDVTLANKKEAKKH